MTIIINFFIKTIKFVLLVALVVFSGAWFISGLSYGIFIFMLPFVFTLALFFLLKTKIGITVAESIFHKSTANTASDVLTTMDPQRIQSPTGFFVPSILETP